MAALSADASRKTRNRGDVKVAEYTVATGVTLYKGSLVSVNTSGRAVAASNAASRKFVGLATEKVTGTASGGEKIKVEYNIEALINALTALTTAYIGCDAFASTDNDVTRSSAYTSAVRVQVGEITEFEGGDAWVWLRKFSNKAI